MLTISLRSLAIVPALLLLSSNKLWAQSSLTLSSATAQSGGAVTLNLTFASTGASPTALQWTLVYPGTISNLSASAGPVLSAAGKTLSCTSNAGSYICVASGMNTNTIANGVAATVTATLAGSSSAAIGVINALGATAGGSAVTLIATGGTVNAAAAALTATALTCSPSTLAPGASSACTVTVSGTSGATVGLSSNSAMLTVPASVTVPAGANGATFLATAGQFTTNQSPTVTASLGGVSQTAMLSLVSPAVVSSLQCAVATLAANSNTTCTVTLNKPASTGGATVTLASNNNSLVIPGSVAVPANASSATFTAAAGNLTTSQSVVITGTLSGSSASYNMILAATAATLVSLNCAPATLPAGGSSACTLTLNKSTAAGISVAVASNNANVTAPATVPVAAGSASALFTAVAGNSFTTDQTATLTATLTGSVTTALLNLTAPVAPPVVSSLACSPTSLASNTSTNCTITLNKPATAGGAVVSILNSSSLLSAASSITVSAGATTAVFIATVGVVSSDQTATLTAVLGGSSGSAVIGLAAAPLVSSLSCTPTSLGSNASANCTVTLTKPATAAGAVVAILSNNGALTVPASITVTGGATTASFTASTGTLASDQSATLTATLGASSVTAVVGLGAATSISSLSCNPASLGANASGTCTVTLTKAAPSPGISVSLTRNTTALSMPASVTVPAAASSANFTIATASLSSDQTATLTAQYGANSVNTDVSLLAPALLSGINCNPNALRPNSSSTCTVTLTKNAGSGGASVAVSTGSSLLSTPSLLTIAAGSTSGSFVLQAGSFTAAQTGSVMVAYNGSTASASVQLLAGVFVSSVACSPKALLSGGTSACTATLSQQVAGDTSLSIGSSSPLLTLPANIVVPAGSATQTFTVTAGSINTDTTAVITATLGASSQSTSITLSATPAVSSLACNPTKLTVGASASCTVTLSQPTGGVFVTLASNNPALVIPSGVAVPQGSTSASFTAVAQSPTTGSVSVTASYNGTTKGTVLTIVAANTSSGPGRLICHPNTLQRGNRGQCRVTLREGGNLPGSEIPLRSSSGSILLPAMLRTRPGQSTVAFQVEAASDESDPVVVEAQLGDEIVRDMISITPDRSHTLRVPGNQYVKYGSELRFQVSSSNASASLSAGELPAGAHFDSTTAEFRWIPDASQIGAHEIQFTAAGARPATGTVRIEVETGTPVITSILNAASRSPEAACSPGAIATVQGRWFTAGSPAADTSGGSFQMAGARVLVNGVAAPILAASAGNLDFLCPVALPGSSLQIEVQTESGVSPAAITVSQAAAPGIFALEGSSQAAARLESGAGLAVIRNHRVAGQPAIAGEQVTVYATGMEGLSNVVAGFGGSSTAPLSIAAVPGHPGIFQVTIAIPPGTEDGELPLGLTGNAPGGMAVTSNIVTVAVEGNAR